MSFKLLAIRPLEGCNKKFLKNLEVNRIYKLYSEYRFLDKSGKEIESFSKYVEVNKIQSYEYVEVPENLFGNKINISAIVGKNGSGKSSLVELLYAAFYNLSIDLKLFEDTKIQREDIFCELFYSKFDNAINEDDFSVIRFSKKRNILKFINLNSGYKFEINHDLFYNIISNYSFYGLNSNYTGNWIQKLFHKNDGYQVPIVLNPMRTDGVIDVNREYILAKDRLLSNVMNNKDIDVNSKILIKGKKVSGLILKLKEREFKIRKIDDLKEKMYLEKYLLKIINSFKDDNLFESDLDETWIKEIIISNNIAVIKARTYILYKLKKISDTYSNGGKSFQKINFEDEKSVDGFLNNIKNNDFGSHITFKIRQAINFLKFDIYPKIDEINYFNEKLDLISDEIFAFRKNSILKYKEKVEEKNPGTFIVYPFWLISNISILPPPIYDIEYVFEDNSKFSELSSGETQNIFSVGTILYHINNISSKHHSHFKEKDIKYKFINIIFDEIELYAHPEMQRSFIKNLLYKVNVSNFRGLEAINMIFITHSPFILSDIPKQNVLFLKTEERKIINKKGEAKNKILSIPQDYKGDNTFGENIHQMLTDGFFISNTKGEFALSKINEFLEFYKKNMNLNKIEKPIDIEKELERYKKLISLLGEDYVRNVLNNHLEDLFKHFNISYTKTRKELENEKNDLEKKLKAINNQLNNEKN